MRQDRIPSKNQHGITRDLQGQDQPTDKSCAWQSASGGPSAGEETQRDAATEQPQSPGEPAGGE
jgi:hypothetical protein